MIPTILSLTTACIPLIDRNQSCRGILLQRSLLTPQGLEFDRQWAIRGIKSKKLLTAREYPEASLPLARASFDQKEARGVS